MESEAGDNLVVSWWTGRRNIPSMLMSSYMGHAITCPSMEPEQRQILRRWRVELVENINVKDGLYTQLYSRYILCRRAINRIKNNRTPQDQVEELLDELQKKNCFEQFCEALIANNQQHIVRKFLKQTTSSVDGRRPGLSTATSSSSIVQNRCEFITLSQNTMASNLEVSQFTSPHNGSGPSDVLTPSEEPLPMMSTSPPVRDPGFMDQFGLSRSDAVDLRSEFNHSNPLVPHTEVICPTLTSDEIDNIDLPDGCMNVKVEHCSEEFFHSNYKKSYPMRRMPRGCALIINVNEVVGKPARTGTNFDRDNLCNLLSQLHFNITVYDDKDGLSAQEMVLKLKSFAKLEQHHQADACFICLLSHGEEEYIFGTDGKRIPLNEIFMLFDNNNCKGLIGKPKVFIIQACRGRSLDRGVMLDETDGGSIPNRSGSRLPFMSDMLICYPPIMDYYTWQHQAHGSWYVKAIVQIFMRYAKNEDVCAMLNRVNHLVSRKVSASCLNEMNQMSQMCEYKSILCYPHFYLFPGIAINNTPSTEPAESGGEQEIIGSQGQQTQFESLDRQLRRQYVSDIVESVAKLNIV